MHTNKIEAKQYVWVPIRRYNCAFCCDNWVLTDEETASFAGAMRKFHKLFNMPKEEKLVNCESQGYMSVKLSLPLINICVHQLDSFSITCMRASETRRAPWSTAFVAFLSTKYFYNFEVKKKLYEAPRWHQTLLCSNKYIFRNIWYCVQLHVRHNV